MDEKKIIVRLSFLIRKVVIPTLTVTGGLVFGQLTRSENHFWMKSTPSAREVEKCKDESLLNFHCGIKDRKARKEISSAGNKGQTFTVVHRSKADEMIWEISKKVTLRNTSYQKENSKDQLEIKKKPSIFSYIGNSGSNNNLSDSLRIRFDDQNIYELIFLPKKVTTMDLNKIHSYLSIKYGISLEQGKYYNSEEKVIWDPEQHGSFTFRPTGLGRDDGNELYQKQSSNQSDEFLTIGKDMVNRTNNSNSSIIDNHNFVLWSDDNKAMSLRKDKDLEVLERNWEINFIGDKIKKSDYAVRISKETINPSSEPKKYWMLLKSKEGEIRKIQGSENGNFISFTGIQFINAFDSGNMAHFTFGTGPLKDSQLADAGITEDPVKRDDISLEYTKISLYPNPVKKGQDFTVVFPPMENLTISVYDGGGRLVVLDNISKTARSYSNRLTMQSSYLVNLTKNGKIIKTFKLIVD